MIEFKVSVIIPVYNAAMYVEQAVESAIHLKEVGEVILVEDGSPDNALDVCKKLEGKYQNIVLLQHEGHRNKGAGASRNLGIRHAMFDYIAFLDADDWYLPNRFVKDSEVFSLHPDADGVYGATGFYYQDTDQLCLNKLTTLQKNVEPGQLIFSLLDGKGGHFTTDAITLKKSFLEKVGYFDESLKLHQDTHLWFRCAVQGRLYASEIEEAIALRRVHSGNRNSNHSKESNSLFYQRLFMEFRGKEINKRVFMTVFKRYIGTRTTFNRCLLALLEIVRSPRVLFYFLFNR